MSSGKGKALDLPKDSELEGRALGNQPASPGRLTNVEGQAQIYEAACPRSERARGKAREGPESRVSRCMASLLSPAGCQTQGAPEHCLTGRRMRGRAVQHRSPCLSAGPGAAGWHPVHQPALRAEHTWRGSAPVREPGLRQHPRWDRTAALGLARACSPKTRSDSPPGSPGGRARRGPLVGSGPGRAGPRCMSAPMPGLQTLTQTQQVGGGRGWWAYRGGLFPSVRQMGPALTAAPQLLLL